MIKSIKVRKTLVWSLKLILFVGVLYFFVLQFSRLSLSQFQTIKITRVYFIFVVLILLPFNWGLELLKWKHILKVNNIHVSLKTLVYSLFSGVTTGIITPNRIGNFIGRMLFFKGKVRAQLILGTLYSNFSQFLVTVIFGAFSFLTLHSFIFESYGTSIVNTVWVISFISIVFYFLVPFISFPQLKILNKKWNVLNHFQKYSKKLVFPLFIYSSMRYLVFTFQFLLMLMAFGEEPSFNLYTGIFMLYFISTLTPSLIFGKLIVRETVGLVILSFFIDNDAVIVVSSLLLWFVNLGVPSLIGLFFIIRKKSLVNG